MTAPGSVPLHVPTEQDLASASPDLPRRMVKTFTDALISADADTLCNAGYGSEAETAVTGSGREPGLCVGLDSALADRLPPCTRPRKVTVLDQLPLNADGEIDRPALLKHLGQPRPPSG